MIHPCATRIRIFNLILFASTLGVYCYCLTIDNPIINVPTKDDLTAKCELIEQYWLSI